MSKRQEKDGGGWRGFIGIVRNRLLNHLPKSALIILSHNNKESDFNENNIRPKERKDKIKTE